MKTIIVTCECGRTIEVNPAAELGKMSAKKRDTSSEAMKKLRAKRDKKRNKK